MTAASADPGTPTDPAPRPIRLCVMATVDITIQNLCRGRLEYLIARGFEVTVVCAPTPMADEIRRRGVRLFTPPLTRAMTPWTDIKCLWVLWRFFRRERFDIVEVSTPKAALLGVIAARLARQPCVVHLLRGLAYQRQRGLGAKILRWSQRIACRRAHHVMSISRSMAEQAYRDGLCASGSMILMGRGSSNGVDLERFSPGLRVRRAELRQGLGIAPDAVVVGFVGRMTADKGLVELMDAFEGVARRHPEAVLLFVGDYEERDRPPSAVMERIDRVPFVRRAGWQADTAPYYGVMDVLALPSYREGFGAGLLEAAAAGVPVIASDIEGCRDAVDGGVTGLLVPAQDARALEAALERLVSDAGLRARMGAAGRAWAEQHFDQQVIWRMYEEHYRRFVESAAN